MSHRVMSTFLAMLMVFTTVMPYTAFAEDTLVIGDGSGSGAIELVGAGSTAAGTEAENIVDAGEGEESSLISTDQGNASSAASADASASGTSGASDAAASDASGAASDDLFGDAGDASDADASAEYKDTAAVNPYLDDETRDIYLVNRNSYEDLQLWNENKDGDEAVIWVQHVEEPGTDTPYTLYGTASATDISASDGTDAAAVGTAAAADGSDAGSASASTSYRFEEIKLTKTGEKDAKGGDIYSASIPESWKYIVFDYFADDADLKEDTRLDDAGYPVSTATNGRHRTMIVKVDDKKTWTVMVPFTSDEKAEAGIDSDTPAWTNLDITKTDALQAFYVNAEHYEDAEGQTYRKPMVERLDGQDESETAASETSAETAQSETAEIAGSETAASETNAETAQSETDAASSTEIASETGAQTTTEASPVVEIVGTNTNTTTTEAGTETETESEKIEETAAESETQSETVDQAESETAEQVEDETETESQTTALPGRFNLLGGPRKAPAGTQYYTVYFLNKPYNFSVNNVSYDWSQKTVNVHAWGSSGDVTVSAPETATTGDTTAEYAPTDSGATLYKFQIPTTATNFMFYVGNYDQKTSDLSLNSSVDGSCYYVNSGSQGDGAIIVNMNNSPIASTNGVKKNTPSGTLELTVNGTVYTNDSSDTTNEQIETLKTNGVFAVKEATISASVSKTGSDYSGVSYSWTSDSSAVSISDASSTTPTITTDDWGFANITLTITKSGDSTETITFPVTVGYDAAAQSDVISMNPGDVVMFYDTTDTSDLTWSKTGEGSVGLSAENGDTLNKKTGASVTTSYDAANNRIAFYVKALEAGAVTLTGTDAGSTTSRAINITVAQDTSVTKTVAVDSTLELSSTVLPLNDYYYDNSDSITWTVSDTAGATISSDGTTFGETAATSSRDDKLTIKGVSDKVVTVTGGNYVITVTVGAGKPAAKTKTVYFWCQATTTFNDKTWWTTNVGIQGSKDNGSSWIKPTDSLGFMVGKTYDNAPDGFEAKVATDYVDIAPNAAVLYEFTILDDWTTIRFVSGGTTNAKDTSNRVTPGDGDVYYLQSVSDTNGAQALTTTTVKNLSPEQSDGYRHLYKSTSDTMIISLVQKKTKLTLTADMETILVGETTDLTATPSLSYTPEGKYNWLKADQSGMTDVIKYYTDQITDQIESDNTSNAKPSLVQDWNEEEDSALIAGSADVEEEDSSKNKSSDSSAEDAENADSMDAEPVEETASVVRHNVAVPTGTSFGNYASMSTGDDSVITVIGNKEGYAKVQVSAADKYSPDVTVTSNEVTLQVVNARLLPDSATIDLQNTPSGDAVDTQFQVQVGDIPYTDVVWTLTPDNGPNSTTNYSDAEKKTLTDNVTVTAAGTGTDSLVATVKAVNGTDMPTTGKMTLTATVYNGEHTDANKVWTGTAAVTVLTYPTTDGYFYIDTTLSRVNQAGATYADNAIPSTNSTTGSIFINYYDANSQWISRVEVQNNSSNVPTVQIGDNTWKYTYRVNNVPTNAKYIQIGSNANVLSLQNKFINATAKLELPASDSKNNCYYLDDADPLVYWNNGTDRNRGGYWAPAYTIRKPDDENTANKSLDTTRYATAVDNAGSLTKSTTTNSLDVYNPDNSDQTQVAYWANSSFYDYYSDIELNGMNRSKWFGDGNGDNTPSHRTYSTFRQLDQALSDYYSGYGSQITYPLYTGHFQPNVYQGIHFADIESSLDLYGWDNNYNAFMSTNNSTVDLAGGGSASDRKYDMADQGLVGQSLSGGLTMANGASDTGIPLPYFSSSFLAGNNSKNMVLGETYSNVAFPFTRYDRDNNGVYYYVFDSAQTTLHMENGFLTTKYVASYDKTKSAMQNASTWNGQDRSGLSWSKNTDVTGGVDSNSSKGNGVSNTWGFFPLNATDFNGPNAAKNNYGFGCKLTIPFKLNDNGDAITYDSSGNKTGEVAQSFTFSGDDDVWVFIDGQLVLDMGGDHGRVSGCINFSSDNAYNYKYYTGKTYANSYTEHTASVPALSTFVSQVKKSPATGTGNDGEFKNGKTEALSLGNLADGKTHTLTMYYMERGQWESNMKVEFSYIPTTTVNVEKKFISDGNDVTEKTTGSIYVCLTRKLGENGTEELVPLNENGTSARTKYCKKISSTDEWKGAFTDLTESATVKGKEVKYIYSVHEVVSTNGNIATDGKDAAGVYKPKRAAVNDTITMNGTSYTLTDSTTDAATGTTTLTNTHTSTTSVKVEKRFDLSSVNNDISYLPDSIKIKLQRAVGSEIIKTTTDSTGKETKEKSWTEPASTAKWTDVAVDGQGEDGWYELKSTSTTPDGSHIVTWSKTFPNLPVYPSDSKFVTDTDDSTKQTRTVYFYRVVEYSGDTNTGSAADGSTVLQDGKVFVVSYNGDAKTQKTNVTPADQTANSITSLLTNTPVPTELTIKKVWSGTDTDTRPTSIKIKVQRAELSNFDSDNKLALPTDQTAVEQLGWTDLTLAQLKASSDTTMSQDSTTKWITWTSETNAGETWTKTFSNLPIAPADRESSDVFYVYRIIEAANGNAEAGTALTAAENGGSATYSTGSGAAAADSSYFVSYSTETVTVTRTAVAGSNPTAYTYEVTKSTKGDSSAYINAGTAEVTNTLQVHLPSTGSRTAMILTLLSLICLAAAGSFGIFGRKKYVE